MIYRAIVNTLIPPVDYPASLLINRSDWGQVLWAIKQGVPHYIRHRGTTRLFGVPPTAGFYEPKSGDVYLVVRLKPGIAPGDVEVEASPDDLEVLKVEVL
jgi:hypothetical protein